MREKKEKRTPPPKRTDAIENDEDGDKDKKGSGKEK